VYLKLGISVGPLFVDASMLYRWGGMPGLVSLGFCGREKMCGEWSVSRVCDLSVLG